MPFTPRTISDNFEKLPFSDDEKALLRRCLETPWDDAPLLVYADWVEEHGEEERADFIRKQVRTGEVVDWQSIPKEVRAWGKKIFPVAKESIGFYRGFPSHEEFSFGKTSLSKFSKRNLTDLWDWVFSMEYEYAPPEDDYAFFHDEYLRQLTSIKITGDGYPSDDVRFSDVIEPFMLTFLSSPYLTNLTKLAFDFPEMLDHLAELVQTKALKNVTSIEFRENTFQEADMKAFVEKNKLSGLTHFGIDGGEVKLDALRKFASSKVAKQLISLRLHYARITAKGAEIISQSKQFQNLRKLDVSGGSVGNAGAKHLASSNFLKELRWLNLNSSRINRTGIVAIGNSPIFSNLIYLDLSSNLLEDDGARALTKSKHLENLKELNLTDCDISKKGMLALINSEFIERLDVLRISENEIDIEVITAIANSSHLSSLKELYFELGNLSKAERKLLQNSPHLQKCKLLHDFN